MKVGYLCTFTPKELIDAAGFIPIRLLADDTPISFAAAYIQSYSCSQARGVLEKALRKKIDVDAIIFTRSCDTLMRLADLVERATGIRVYNFEFPTKIDEFSKSFLLSEISDLAKKLEDWGGEISFESLKECIELYEILEKKMAEIFAVRPDYELLFNVQQMKVKDALKIIKNPEKRIDGPRILITGSVCPFLNILKLFEEIGFSIKDDLCTGTRFFTFKYPKIKKLNSIEDCFNYLAEKYLYKAECPCKHYKEDRRFLRVIELAKDCDGVVFLLLKFCDPHFFDYPQLKKKLEEMGKKVLLLEIEFPVASLEQIKNRLEAFYEVML